MMSSKPTVGSGDRVQSTAIPDLLDSLLDRRFHSIERASSLSAIVSGAPELRSMTRELSDDLTSNQKLIAKAMVPDRIEGLARSVALTMRRHLGQRHQYVHFDSLDDIFLIDRYRDLLSRFANTLVTASQNTLSRAVERELVRHHDRLMTWVRSKLAAADALAWFERGGDDTVCAEYSPATQMQVLGIEPSRLLSPILDLGCGTEARLVTHLSSLGFEHVVGIDRDGGGGLALRCDWFTLPMRPRSWGTIIAHQSFSLHFTNAHLRSSSTAARFAEAYMGILQCLKPGGSFIYAPSLPFIEALLPKQCYEVQHRTVEAPHLRLRPSWASSQVTNLG